MVNATRGPEDGRSSALEGVSMATRIVIVGGGAAGIGAAGAFKGTQPDGEVIVFTEYEDAAYSPCGIPYVHGKEIPSFEALFLATKQPTSTRASTSATRHGSPRSTRRPARSRSRGKATSATTA